ncbi:MAG: sugar phosphate isomerase/epimerase family protein, partial [Planctomycetota bacterium]
ALHWWLPQLLPTPSMAELNAWNWRPGPPEIPAWMHAPSDPAWIEALAKAVADSGLEQEALAMEKGYLILVDPAQQETHRRFLRAWVDCAGTLGIPALRVDPGPMRDCDRAARQAVIQAYREEAAYAADRGVRIFVENHWGLSQDADFLEELLDAVPAVGYLLDSNNFAPEEREANWHRLVHRAAACHLKTFELGDTGVEPRMPVHKCIELLAKHDPDRLWGIESMPTDGDEMAGVRRTVALIERTLCASKNK